MEEEAEQTGVAEVGSKLTALRERTRQGLTTALAPLTNFLGALGVSADQLTWFGFVLAISAAFLAGYRVFIAAGIIYLIVGIVDLMDGALARRANASSAGGAFLDSVFDRFGEGVIHVGVAVAFAWWHIWIGVLAVALSLTGSYLTSYARARAEGLGIELPEVWFGRGERLTLLGFSLIFHFALIAFWILVVASWLSAAHRSWLAWHRLEPAPEAEEHPAESAESNSEEPLAKSVEPEPKAEEPPVESANLESKTPPSTPESDSRQTD